VNLAARHDGAVRDEELGPDAEADGLARLRETGDAIATGVAREIPRWSVVQVARILDAWGKAESDTRARAQDDARAAGDSAAARIDAELRALLATDPSAQRSTPLEIVRTAYREPTAVLVAAGVPPVTRDAFDERAHPDDRYDLAPRTFGDLGDPDLAPLHLAWGLAKATVLRARARGTGGESA
jgi:hypothetical protein